MPTTRTPAEFAERMREIQQKHAGDEEAIHAHMDDLMELVLRQLGYDEGCDIFAKQEKWCA